LRAATRELDDAALVQGLVGNVKVALCIGAIADRVAEAGDLPFED
jgi:hypothetical protein